MKPNFTFSLIVFLCIASCKEDYEVVPYVVNIEDATIYDYSSKNLLFSVSNTKKVYFSKGNLQYQASTNMWRFAEHQYDYNGDYIATNSSITTEDKWIDLFGYGTSGYDGKYPYMNNSNSGDYYTSDIFGTNYDWGVYNRISNGGNKPGLWRTLTYDEWNYLLFKRKNANEKKKQTTIGDIYGWVLLPDNWEKPKRVSLSSTLTIREWKKLEDSGAVFLPYNRYIEYWTGSINPDDEVKWPYSIYLRDSYIEIRNRFYGEKLAVRLVCDADKCDVLKLVK